MFAHSLCQGSFTIGYEKECVYEYRGKTDYVAINAKQNRVGNILEILEQEQSWL